MLTLLLLHLLTATSDETLRDSARADQYAETGIMFPGGMG